MRRRVVELLARLRNVGEGVADVAGAERAVVGVGQRQTGPLGLDVLHEGGVELVERGAVAVRDVVHRAGSLGRGDARAEVGLHNVRDVAEVAARVAIAEDRRPVAVEELADPFGDHGGVGPARVLPPAEHVEVAEPDHLEPVVVLKGPGVEFVRPLGHGVGRERRADLGLHLRQPRMIAIHRRRRGVDEARHARVARRDEHVHEPVHVDGVRRERIFDGARHRPERRLMQHDVGPRHTPGGTPRGRGRRLRRR